MSDISPSIDVVSIPVKSPVKKKPIQKKGLLHSQKLLKIL